MLALVFCTFCLEYQQVDMMLVGHVARAFSAGGPQWFEVGVEPLGGEIHCMGGGLAPFETSGFPSPPYFPQLLRPFPKIS